MSGFCRFELDCARAGTWRCQFCIRIVQRKCSNCGLEIVGYRGYKNKLYYEKREFKGSLRPLFEHYHPGGNEHYYPGNNDEGDLNEC